MKFYIVTFVYFLFIIEVSLNLIFFRLFLFYYYHTKMIVDGIIYLFIYLPTTVYNNKRNAINKK